MCEYGTSWVAIWKILPTFLLRSPSFLLPPSSPMLRSFLAQGRWPACRPCLPAGEESSFPPPYLTLNLPSSPYVHLHVRSMCRFTCTYHMYRHGRQCSYATTSLGGYHRWAPGPATQPMHRCAGAGEGGRDGHGFGKGHGVQRCFCRACHDYAKYWYQVFWNRNKKQVLLKSSLVRFEISYTLRCARAVNRHLG